MCAYIEESLQKREPFYSKAKHILDVDLLDNHTKIQCSVRLICNLLGLPYTDNLSDKKQNTQKLT